MEFTKEQQDIYKKVTTLLHEATRKFKDEKHAALRIKWSVNKSLKLENIKAKVAVWNFKRDGNLSGNPTFAYPDKNIWLQIILT